MHNVVHCFVITHTILLLRLVADIVFLQKDVHRRPELGNDRS